MGNTIRYLAHEAIHHHHHHSDGASSAATSPGVSALAHDLNQFELTSEVPEGLSQLVVSSKKAQANWYTKLLQTWQEAKPAPETPEQVSALVIQTLKHHKKDDVEGFLKFYGLPLQDNPHVESTPESPDPVVVNPTSRPEKVPTSRPEGVKFELHTLPVDAKAIPDGDTITVYVSASEPREAHSVPKAVHVAASQRAKARASKDYPKADALHKTIIEAGYRVITGSNDEDILAKKYRVRLSGIDCPESKMPYGQEAKQELIKLVQGKCLLIHVYTEDRYGRLVGDIHCNGKFVQEVMLKKGCAWHYAAYDKRPELIKWENAARAKQVGLWASPNPEKPWEWRKNKRDGNC